MIWAIVFGLGLLAGLVLGVGGMVFWMRRSMIQSQDIPLKFEDAEKRLLEGVAAQPSWGHPVPDLDFVAALSRRNVRAEGVKKAKIFFLCNPQYAAKVVGADLRIIGMMPCHWALAEDNSGRVHLSRLNIPAMSRIFSQPVKGLMGQVGRDEERMLQGLVGGPDRNPPGV